MTKERKWGIRNKLMVLLVSVVLVPMVIATVVAVNTIASRMRTLIEENVDTAARSTSEIMGEFRERLFIKAENLSSDPELLLFLTTRRDESIREILPERMKAMDVDELTILDPQGIVIGRGYNEEYGDDNSGKPDIKIALAGQKYLGPQVEKEGELFISAIIPIKSGEQIVGIIDVNEKVNQPWLDGIKKIVGMDISEFQGSKLLVTTITGPKGERATTIPEAEETFERIKKGEEGFDVDLEIFGEETECRYFSLKGPSEEIIGFYIVSTPTTKALIAQAQARNRLILTSIIALIIAIILGFLFARNISNPLRRITEIVGEIAREGDLKKRIDIKGIKFAEEEEEEEEEEAISKDEITQIARSFNSLMRSMRSLATQAKAIADDDLKNKVLEKKIKGDLGEAFSAMVVNLRGLADQAQAIANDDLDNPVLTKVGKGTLGSATTRMVENLKGLSKQAESISKYQLDNPILKEEAKGVLGSSFARMVMFLRGIAQKTTIVAKGDLTPTIETKGTLSDAFNLMITSLKELAKRLKDSSNQIASATGQILTASQQQATGIEEEATQISQTATSAKQLAITSKQVTDLSNEISKSSISSVEMANSGAQAVDNTIKGMEKIRQSVLETSKKIEGLSEKGQAINEVVTLIDDIANQTNLLSLNASIEAARAGEAGKGFAVVADAIGKLADRTTKSTKDISDLIKSVQQDTSGCVMSMEESTKETEKGSSLVQEAGKAIKGLVSSFEHVAQSAKEIVLASQQQTSGSTQISKGMMGIDDIMKQSAAGAKQSTESARELSKLAEELKKAVGQFKLGGEEERV